MAKCLTCLGKLPVPSEGHHVPSKRKLKATITPRICACGNCGCETCVEGRHLEKYRRKWASERYKQLGLNFYGCLSCRSKAPAVGVEFCTECIDDD